DQGRSGGVRVLTLANDPDRVLGARLALDLGGVAEWDRYLVTTLGAARIGGGQLVPLGADAFQSRGRRLPGDSLAVRLVERLLQSRRQVDEPHRELELPVPP